MAGTGRRNRPKANRRAQKGRPNGNSPKAKHVAASAGGQADGEPAARWKTAGRAERERIFAHYLPLVRVAARVLFKRLRTDPLVSVGDLVSYGAIGLLRALDRFDPALGVKFTTYCAHRVRGAMLDAVRSLDWVPRAERDREKRGEVQPPRMEQAELELLDALGAPGPAEPAEEVPADRVWRRAMELPPAERRVLALRYRTGLSADQIARALQCSVEDVRRIHGRALARLREELGLEDALCSGP